MRFHIYQVLDQRFECPDCHSSGSWKETGRPEIRQNSTIHRLTCGGCGKRIVAKAVCFGSSADDGGQSLQKEYQRLQQLQSTLPQDGRCGALVPLGYLELDGCGVMITCQFDGSTLTRWARVRSQDDVRPMFRAAGLLLRKLHDISPGGYKIRVLDVEEKVLYLKQEYEVVLYGDRSMRGLCDHLEQRAAQLREVEIRTTWNHGDFKPENVLCDGHKCLVMDTGLNFEGAFVYDIASFLDHVQLAGRQLVGSSRIGRAYCAFEEEFLSGYGHMSEAEVRALRWVQLYFMLHYLGRDRRHGLLAAAYANWRIRPLVEQLAAQI